MDFIERRQGKRAHWDFTEVSELIRAIAPNSESLLPTIRSRCSLIPFRNLGQQEMCEILESTGHSQILVRPEIIEMVQRCPRNAIAAWNHLTQVEQIDPRVLLVPSSCQPLSVLSQLAKTITQKLDISTQLWLLDYWQHQLWKAQRNTLIAEILSSAKQ